MGHGKNVDPEHAKTLYALYQSNPEAAKALCAHYGYKKSTSISLDILALKDVWDKHQNQQHIFILTFCSFGFTFSFGLLNRFFILCSIPCIFIVSFSLALPPYAPLLSPCLRTTAHRYPSLASPSPHNYPPIALADLAIINARISSIFLKIK